MTAESRLTLLLNICTMCPFLFNPISWEVIAKLADKSVYTVKCVRWQTRQQQSAALWKLFILSLLWHWWITYLLCCFTVLMQPQSLYITLQVLMSAGQHFFYDSRVSGTEMKLWQMKWLIIPDVEPDVLPVQFCKMNIKFNLTDKTGFVEILWEFVFLFFIY